MTRSPFALLALASGLLLAACGGDSPTDPGDDPTDPPVDTRTIKDNPSFANDVMEVFTRTGCTSGGCHGGGAGMLTLVAGNAATSYANLVGVTSPASGEVRVIPSNANDSYLVKKLEGRQSVGSRMPLGGTPLDNIDMSNIKNWITQGAANN